MTMGPTQFLEWAASRNRQIDAEEKARNANGGGIEHSHGKDWIRRRKIGEGGGGSVYLADLILSHGWTSQIAVKSAPMGQSSNIRREKRVFSVLNGSPNLVWCYGHEITKTKSGQRIYNLLMDYCSGGSLDNHIINSPNGLPETEVRSYARDIAQGLDCMHMNGYVHGDIKPDNILLAPEATPFSSEKVKYAAKIADFGLSVDIFVGGGDRFKIRGTSGYMAPEMVRNVEIGFPADIWSYGCTVLEMLTGEPAWGAELMKKCDQEVMEYTAYSNASPRIPDRVSEKARDFLSKCLNPVCELDRWAASMLLEHPFLAETTVEGYSY